MMGGQGGGAHAAPQNAEVWLAAGGDYEIFPKRCIRLWQGQMGDNRNCQGRDRGVHRWEQQTSSLGQGEHTV